MLHIALWRLCHRAQSLCRAVCAADTGTRLHRIVEFLGLVQGHYKRVLLPSQQCKQERYVEVCNAGAPRGQTATLAAQYGDHGG